MSENVILVDKNDKEIGVKEKIQAHEDADLHRAFSVYIFNSKVELMMQKRASDKYHNGGLWSNTCCSHPRPNEDTKDAAERRLDEEMGFTVPLREIETFIYKADFSNGLTEHEYLHVFTGSHDDNPVPDKKEIGDWKWMNTEDLKKDMKKNQDNYTHWFRISIDKVISAIQNKKA